MRDIQEVSLEILKGTPNKFYILCGEEYGIKLDYLCSIKSYYGGKQLEMNKVSDVIGMMKRKTIVPVQESLYVVRYDNEFLSSLTSSYAQDILKCKMKGTLVVIYNDEKDTSKCDKYLPNNTVVINKVSDKLVYKYIKSSYGELGDRLCSLCVKAGVDYGQSRQIAYSISKSGTQDKLMEYRDDELLSVFDYKSFSTLSSFRIGLSSRNFVFLCNLLEHYEEEYDDILYNMMNTLSELEKLKTYKTTDSDLSKYLNMWSFPDIYNMFMNVYQELKQWRTNLSVYKEDRLLYLFSLLQFKNIPDPGDLK